MYDCFLFNDMFVMTIDKHVLEQVPLDVIWVQLMQPANAITLLTPEKSLQFSNNNLQVRSSSSTCDR